MVVMQDEQGLLFYPDHRVASFTPDYGARWRVVMDDGSVANRPFVPPQGAWVQLGSSWVLPALMTPIRDGWVDPAGFVYPAGPLPEPGPRANRKIHSLPCQPQQVIRLLVEGNHRCRWFTDVGEFPISMSANQAAALHPDMIRFQQWQYVNRQRIRRIIPGSEFYHLLLDEGTSLPFHRRLGDGILAKALGLPHVRYLEPRFAALERYHLRDYPYELATAPAARLKTDFSSPQQLMANLVWQTFRYRQLGEPRPYGVSYRGFWYLPVVTTLYRAGFLSRARLQRVDDLDSDTGYQQLQAIVAQMIGEDRLFTFEDLGFQDPRPELRRLGATRPDVVVIAEKESLFRDLLQLNEDFGVSVLMLGGVPSLLTTEYFVRLLRTVWQGPVLVLAFTDFDPGGWTVGYSCVHQFDRFGLTLSRPLQHVVRAECFSPKELELFALPCPGKTPSQKTLAANWVKASGGIGGRAFGIHANHLQPYERVRERVAELLSC